MTHLGGRVSALLDGQLSLEATERAMVHLVGCRDCRDAVEIERLTKARLVALSGPAPSGELVGRLLALGGPHGPLPPRPGYVPGSPRPKTVAVAAPAPARAAAVRELVRAASVRPPMRRPGTGPGRAATGSPRYRRARLAGAVLGALGVVGVGGLILAERTTAGVGSGAGVDSLRVQQPVATPGLLGRGPRFVPPLVTAVPVAYQGPH
ncbi:MAG TPA: zf-HC2 domain-containing protein [Kineosporiaceae bacterium]